jgi:hypothetical protein
MRAGGSLAVVMILMSPVSHQHYQVFALPLVAGLWLTAVAERPGRMTPGGTTMIVLALWGLVIGTSLMPIPGWKELRPFGTGTAATLVLWAYGVRIALSTPRPATHRHADARAAKGTYFFMRSAKSSAGTVSPARKDTVVVADCG